jgi:hypothetical protein
MRAEATHTFVTKRVERSDSVVTARHPERGRIGDVVRNERTGEMFVIEAPREDGWRVRRAVGSQVVSMHPADRLIVVGQTGSVR